MSPHSKRNIAREIRESLQARFERRETLDRAAAAAPDLFETGETESAPVRKGSWEVFHAPKGEESAEFVAVYRREGKARTIVIGPASDRTAVRAILSACATRIIEQRPIVSWPPRALNEENGFSNGIRTGLMIAVLLTLLVAVDLVLLPEYPEVVLQAMNITAGDNPNAYDADSRIFAYESVTARLVEGLFPASQRHLATSMYTLVAVFVIPILLAGLVYEIGGKLADRGRNRVLAPLAGDCRFGMEAAGAVLELHAQATVKRAARDLHQILAGRGLEMALDEFSDLFASHSDRCR